MAGTATRVALIALLAACLGLGGYVIGNERSQQPADAGTVTADSAVPPSAGSAGKAATSKQATGAPALPTRTTTSAGHCDGALVREKVREVTVPDGAECVLVGTRVGSNISVGHDARLQMHGSKVGGDVEGEDARAVAAMHSVVSGNLQLEGGGQAYLSDSHVDGDVEWQDQHGTLVAQRSSVGGNLEVAENAGGVTITGNRIDGDLECDGNKPAPTGSGNTVRGHRTEQCHGL